MYIYIVRGFCSFYFFTFDESFLPRRVEYTCSCVLNVGDVGKGCAEAPVLPVPGSALVSRPSRSRSDHAGPAYKTADPCRPVLTPETLSPVPSHPETLHLKPHLSVKRVITFVQPKSSSLESKPSTPNLKPYTVQTNADPLARVDPTVGHQ